jgi:hypothetical protein
VPADLPVSNDTPGFVAMAVDAIVGHGDRNEQSKKGCKNSGSQSGWHFGTPDYSCCQTAYTTMLRVEDGLQSQ